MTSLRRHAVRLLPGLPLFLVACAALVAALSAEPAETTRYVAPWGSDGANLCLDPAAPCAGVAHAVGRSAPGDAIILAAGTYPVAGLVIPHSLALRGDGAAVLDGGGQDTLLIIPPDAAVVVEGLTLRGGAGARGGAARVEPGGDLTLRRVVAAANRADWGGGIYVAGGRLTVEDGRLSDNDAGAGGAVYMESGLLAATGTDIAANRAGSGGGVFVGPGATAELRGVTLASNAAETVGGGVHSAGVLTVMNTVVRDNRAATRGGGIFNDGGAAEIDYTTFLANIAPAGAAVAAEGSAAVGLRAGVLVGRDLCDGPIRPAGNLADDATCGAPAQPATLLDGDGRPTHGSSAIDAGPAGACPAAGALLPTDRRGEPRPADGNGDGSARCDPGAFEFQPRLTVIHAPTLTDGARFTYGGDVGAFELSAAERPRHIVEAAPGVYRLEQGAEPGWKLNAITCDGDTDGGSVVDLAARAVAVDLDPGEAIRCVFVARPNRDTIGVAVRAPAGEDAAVAFDGALGAFELRPTAQPDMRSGRLPAGAHVVRAVPPPHLRVAAVACAGDRDGGTTTDSAGGLAVVDLDTKETIGCTFTLAPVAPATLTIRHEAAPASDEPLTFTGDLGVFALRAVSAPARTFSPPPGVYRLRELLHPAWALGRLDCAGDTDGGTVLLPEAGEARVDLDAGEAITCTFGHVRASSGTGSITIIHAADPADATPFPFDSPLGAFTLSVPAAPARAFAELRPGSYAVRQLTPAGWVLVGIACAGDADGGTTLLPDEATALIDLDEDEAIACTFSAARPAQTGAITIVHETTPADDTQFRYNGTLGGFNLRAPLRPSRSFVDLAPGSYQVGSRPQDNWSLYEIVCEGDTDGGTQIDLPGRAAAIDLDAGEAVICRFRHAGPGITPQPTPTPGPTATPQPTPPPGAGWRVYLPAVR